MGLITRIKKFIITFFPIVSALLIWILHDLYLYVIAPQKLGFDWKQSIALIIISFFFTAIIQNHITKWVRRHILWKMSIPSIIFGSIIGFPLFYLLLNSNDKDWLYAFIIVFLFAIATLFTLFEKVYWFLFNHFSKKVPKPVRKRRQQMLYVKMIIPVGSSIPLIAYLSLVMWPEIVASNFQYNITSDFIIYLILLFCYMWLAKIFIDLLLIDTTDRSWKKIIQKIIFPALIFGVIEVVWNIFNPRDFVIIHSSDPHMWIMRHYIIFVLSIGLFCGLYYLRKGLYLFTKWMYERKYKG
jgi:hypothetical protein